MYKACAAVHQLRIEFLQSTIVVAPMQVDFENDLSVEKTLSVIATWYGRVDVLSDYAGKNPDDLRVTQEDYLTLNGFGRPDDARYRHIRTDQVGEADNLNEQIFRQFRMKTRCVSTGFVGTGLGGKAERNKRMGAIDPVIGATFGRNLVEGARDANVGPVVYRNVVPAW
ncbi:hypothetical protein F1880_008499 [Penicillium rolfsii]|nr:hypothetical protein F1880_008499 [Penicillium rolfsii]